MKGRKTEKEFGQEKNIEKSEGGQERQVNMKATRTCQEINQSESMLFFWPTWALAGDPRWSP
jgi:hypothetical protein